MTKSILIECVEIVRSIVGDDYLYLDSSVDVKTSPHSHPFKAYAVSASPKDELYVMDGEEQWHKVELEDVNASLVISSLYQRLKLLRIAYAKAS